MTDNIIDLKPAPSPEPEPDPEFVLSLERQREIYETALEAGAQDRPSAFARRGPEHAGLAD